MSNSQDSEALERHYSPKEIAEAWGLSPDAVRRLLEREPGVLIISSPAGVRKRRYRTMRVPASVVERVHRRLSVRIQSGRNADHLPAPHKKLSAS